MFNCSSNKVTLNFLKIVFIQIKFSKRSIESTKNYYEDWNEVCKRLSSKWGYNVKMTSWKYECFSAVFSTGIHRAHASSSTIYYDVYNHTMMCIVILTKAYV